MGSHNILHDSPRHVGNNLDLWILLDKLLDRWADRRVDIRFWHVLREQNLDADALANAALDAEN